MPNSNTLHIITNGSTNDVYLPNGSVWIRSFEGPTVTGGFNLLPDNGEKTMKFTIMTSAKFAWLQSVIT